MIAVICHSVATTCRVETLGVQRLFKHTVKCNHRSHWRHIAGQNGNKTTVRSLLNSDKKSKPRGYILLVMPLTAFCLGTWQVRRRKWKVGLIEELDSRIRALPVSFPSDLSTLEELEYRKVVVRGKFDNSKELYVLPRSILDGTEPEQDLVGTPGLTGRKFDRPGGKSGAHVITAFQLASDEHPNLRILVNRGWVARNRVNPETRPDAQVDDEIEFVGIVRHTETRMPFAASNKPASNQWFHRDIDAMSQQLDTAPIFIDADRKSTIPGGPIGGQTNVTLRNEHVSYIITWFSLSAITFFMWAKAYWR